MNTIKSRRRSPVPVGCGEYHAHTMPPHRARANVLGVAIDALNLEGALERVRKVLESGERGYVCAVGVHGVLTALSDRRMASALADASIVIPDGTPTVWVGRLQRCEQMGHVPGPTLMQEVFRRKDFTNLTHYLYGGKEGVAGELSQNSCEQVSACTHCWNPYAALSRSDRRGRGRADRGDRRTQAGYFLGWNQHPEAGTVHAQDGRSGSTRA